MGVTFEQSPQWFAWQPLDYVSNGKEGSTWPHPHMYEGGVRDRWRRFQGLSRLGVVGHPSRAGAAAAARLFEAVSARLVENADPMQTGPTA